jgi:hypothetical protein
MESLTLRTMRRALSVIVIALSVAGCATLQAPETRATEQMLSAAGFQRTAPDTPEELARLRSLTPRKILRRERDGDARYVYADLDTCRCIYTGTEQQYQEYRRLVRQQTGADEATLVNEEASDIRLWGLWP